MVPLQVTGFGVCSFATNVAITVLPHASIMFAGAPGSVASPGHDTVAVVLIGGVNPPLYVTV